MIESIHQYLLQTHELIRDKHKFYKPPEIRCDWDGEQPEIEKDSVDLFST